MYVTPISNVGCSSTANITCKSFAVSQMSTIPHSPVFVIPHSPIPPYSTHTTFVTRAKWLFAYKSPASKLATIRKVVTASFVEWVRECLTDFGSMAATKLQIYVKLEFNVCEARIQCMWDLNAMCVRLRCNVCEPRMRCYQYQLFLLPIIATPFDFSIIRSMNRSFVIINEIERRRLRTRKAHTQPKNGNKLKST